MNSSQKMTYFGKAVDLINEDLEVATEEFITMIYDMGFEAVTDKPMCDVNEDDMRTLITILNEMASSAESSDFADLAEEIKKEVFPEETPINLQIKELERRLERQQGILRGLEASHEGNEQNLTYHAGFDLGYVKGKITEIENTIDLLKELR